MARPALRVLVAIVYDVLNAAAFSTRDALTEAIKVRCAKLRVTYDSMSVEAAIVQVERGGKRADVPKWNNVRVEPRPAARERAPADAGQPSPATATKILAGLRRRLGPSVGPRSMPEAPASPPVHLHSANATMVAAQILASIARSEVLEAALTTQGDFHADTPTSQSPADRKSPL